MTTMNEDQADGARGEISPPSGEPTASTYASDPVCGMDVSVAAAEFRSDVAGESYFFCSRNCKDRFDEHPGKYA